MMNKICYKDIPSRYKVCLHADCVRASVCLRQLAYRSLMEKEEVLWLLNPLRCTKDESCPYYRNGGIAVYALGFKGMKERMYPKQYQEFMSILTAQFGRNPYFERRSGKKPLSPKDQRLVLQALKRVGVEENLEFDRYEERVNWND